MNNRLMYFIFMPIVYEIILLLISHAWYCGNNYSKKKNALLFVLYIALDYLIEATYIVIVYKGLREWLTSSILKFNASLEVFDAFFICSLMAITVSIYLAVCTRLKCSDFSIGYNMCRETIIMILCIILALFCNISYEKEVDRDILNSIEYTNDEEKIYLKALSDTYNANGSVDGHLKSVGGLLGYISGYIQGSLTENYTLTYAYLGDKGETVIGKLTYTDDSVDIFEDGDNCVPYLKTNHFYRSYKDLYDEYYKYEIHIPSITNMINVDLQ